MIQRKEYLEKLIKFQDTDFVKVVTGVRRSGKSVLLKLYAEYLEKTGISVENIININFEKFKYQNIKTEEKFRNLIEETVSKNNEKIFSNR